MSWLQRLNETYDACFGQPQFESDPLTPIDHVVQQAHIEVVLDEEGSFLHASVVQKENTLIPATERSAGRTSAPVAHALCDKLRYIAPGLDQEAHQLYIEQLRAWAGSVTHSKLDAVLKYVEGGTVVKDLLAAGTLQAHSDGELETKWADGLSPLAKLLTADPKTRERDQGNALIRWRVELPGEPETSVWKDASLHREWAVFNATVPGEAGLCLNSGSQESLASSHPKRLRHGGDGAKLISSNDSSGFTFRGRFATPQEAYGLSASATQRAHNALRWLIARQGAKSGDQVVVAWAVHGQELPPVAANTSEWFGNGDDWDPTVAEEAKPSKLDAAPAAYTGDAGQDFALKLKQKVRGYRAKLGDRADIVVLALDSATPGRMAILYYRELHGSEFLDRIEHWHSSLAWPQNFGKDLQFVGAPAPRDIAEAAYGRRVDDKLRKTTVERLLPCIVDGGPLPRDLAESVFHRATNRPGMERWEFERVLGIACSLTRATSPEEDYKMSLEPNRTSRDYLFGRLLAVAEQIESYALLLAKESRDTAAERLMQRFADHPAATWRTLENSLKPYMQRLRSQRPGALHEYKTLLDDIVTTFQADDFVRPGRLGPEFLLGYHCQRAALRVRTKNTPGSDEASDAAE